jgi:hypothetical protein
MGRKEFSKIFLFTLLDFCLPLDDDVTFTPPLSQYTRRGGTPTSPLLDTSLLRKTSVPDSHRTIFRPKFSRSSPPTGFRDGCERVMSSWRVRDLKSGQGDGNSPRLVLRNLSHTTADLIDSWRSCSTVNNENTCG